MVDHHDLPSKLPSYGIPDRLLRHTDTITMFELPAVWLALLARILRVSFQIPYISVSNAQLCMWHYLVHTIVLPESCESCDTGVIFWGYFGNQIWDTPWVANTGCGKIGPSGSLRRICADAVVHERCMRRVKGILNGNLSIHQETSRSDKFALYVPIQKWIFWITHEKLRFTTWAYSISKWSCP